MPISLPASAGGLIGLASLGLARHLADISQQGWVAWVIPPLFLVAGLPLAFLATGLQARPISRGAMNAAALVFHGCGILARALRRGHDDEDDDGVDLSESLDVVPEPTAITSREPRRESTRVKREEQRKQPPKPKPAGQSALNLGESEYQLPPLGLLAEPARTQDRPDLSDEALEENARMLEAVLGDFGVRGRIVAVRPGPVVTLYEFEPAAGVKSSRIISLSDDVARSMSAVAARIAAIPGRNVLGIELPNLHRETVYLRELIASAEYEKARAPLILALGKTIGGEAVMADLAKMPHLLIAGTTGSGKSVALNTMILSLLYRLPPDQARMILIDPKMLELSVYEGIPHLLAPVVTDPRKAVVALKWAVREMEERYQKMSKLGVRGVEAFNERVRKAREKGETLKRTVQTGFDQQTGKPIYEDETLELDLLPYIVVVVDEMADLMMISGKEIEGAIQRLAQMARAAGIHLIAATQRPSVDVITGTIKANFPTRISFQVTSKIDSRTILGEQGAEQLLGQGDMLHMMTGGRIGRVHGPFVTDREVEEVVGFLKTQGTPEYLDAVTEEQDGDGEDPFSMYGGGGNSGDELYDRALAIVARDRKPTVSYIQRRLEIGYNRAARLIERMEEEGVISKPNHQGKREVLLPDHGED
jgi:S-DNA-T family DNA segregation ATPase FtsK/SpoIIIE